MENQWLQNSEFDYNQQMINTVDHKNMTLC